jgi:hypothetical protein
MKILLEKPSYIFVFGNKKWHALFALAGAHAGVTKLVVLEYKE